jgi:hypothetical protein
VGLLRSLAAASTAASTAALVVVVVAVAVTINILDGEFVPPLPRFGKRNGGRGGVVGHDANLQLRHRITVVHDLTLCEINRRVALRTLDCGLLRRGSARRR